MIKSTFVKWLEEGSVSIPKLLFNQYVNLGLDELEFMLILHVYTFKESGNLFPTPEELSIKMTISEDKCAELLRGMLQKGFLRIEEQKTEHDIISESYSFQPLWDKLVLLLNEQEKQHEKKKNAESEMNLYTMFEKEFGRPLSPMECETMGMWIDDDQHSGVVIKAALKEAVLSGKLNFRYIDRILFEWKKNGIRTVEQAERYSERFRSNQVRNQSSNAAQGHNQKKVNIPFYNWLEQ